LLVYLYRRTVCVAVVTGTPTGVDADGRPARLPSGKESTAIRSRSARESNRPARSEALAVADVSFPSSERARTATGALPPAASQLSPRHRHICMRTHAHARRVRANAHPPMQGAPRDLPAGQVKTHANASMAGHGPPAGAVVQCRGHQTDMDLTLPPPREPIGSASTSYSPGLPPPRARLFEGDRPRPPLARAAPRLYKPARAVRGASESSGTST
jgi:hypothetical protein